MKQNNTQAFLLRLKHNALTYEPQHTDTRDFFSWAIADLDVSASLDQLEYMPVILASAIGDIHSLTLLLRIHAITERANEWHLQALEVALQENHTRIIFALTQHPAIAFLNPNDLFALGTQYASIELYSQLLKHHHLIANTDPDIFFQTFLSACQSGNINLLNTLLQAQPLKHLLSDNDEFRELCLSVATEHNHGEILQRLLEVQDKDHTNVQKLSKVMIKNDANTAPPISSNPARSSAFTHRIRAHTTAQESPHMAHIDTPVQKNLGKDA